ncbi:MAG: hypothetical protein LBH43_00725 [Treponema sp.]|nr:hypothetical protein [Treponema sp.]
MGRGQRGAALARSRSGKKNDNCFVGQKNGATARKQTGCLRCCGNKGVAALQGVYSHYDRLSNFFYPGRKLLSKEWAGTKVKKTYDKPQAPFERAMASPYTQEGIKQRLKSMKKYIILNVRDEGDANSP